eukprot:gene2024-2157_t
MKLVIAILVSLLCAVTSITSSTEKTSLIYYLQQEQILCSNAQQNILSYLKKQLIPVGSEPRSLQTTSKVDLIEDRTITSTESHPIECRLTLDFAPPGAKCVAPCSCTGSQKWIQFSVLNKLRRKDPKQWITCPTCREPYKHELFASQGGLKSAVIGMLLERLNIIRGLFRYLVSRSFWQMYPKLWIKLVHLPLVFKFWGGKMIASAIWDKYLLFEKLFIVSRLADVETRLIEESLPDIIPKDD